MPKYLCTFDYSAGGTQGLLKDGGSKREKVVSDAVKAAGGAWIGLADAAENDELVCHVKTIREQLLSRCPVRRTNGAVRRKAPITRAHRTYDCFRHIRLEDSNEGSLAVDRARVSGKSRGGARATRKCSTRGQNAAA